ncbi:MAG: translation initiation factor IF-2 N-terminal domain-containing protein, partial [Alistipes sp.]|nr:translation initiation factor IF-2 N-terminal domain-containing protein [Alistipes sp.]
LRERISQKQDTITLEGSKKQEREEEKEVVIKSNVINVRDEIPQPKILGKIDLSPKPKTEAKPAPKAEPAPEPAVAKETPAVAKETPAVAKETPAGATADSAPAAPVKAEEPQPAPAPAAPEVQPEPTAPVQAEEPKAAPETKVEEPQPEAPKDNIFRPETVTLTGPQVLGTMDVSGFVPGGKHKRKRLSKEKVDVTKAQKGGGAQGGRSASQGGPGAPGRGGAQGGRPAQNQPRPGEGRRSKNKKNSQPVIRPEVSDEEVSKQIKDTLARLTAKGAKNTGAKHRRDKREAAAERMNEEMERSVMERSTLKVTEFVTVSELATMMNVAPTEVITACMNLGLMVSIN